MADAHSPSIPVHCELLETLVDNTTSMVSYWDVNQRCRFANRAYERWWGLSSEQMIGMHMSELLGANYERTVPLVEAAMRGEAHEYDREFPDPAGGPPRHVLANTIPDIVDGVVRGVYFLVTDVTAIKRAERALRESEERFRLTIDEAPIGMALVAPDGSFMRVNHALCDLVGYSADELMGMTFQTITHPEDLDADLSQAARLRDGEIVRYKLAKRCIRKDGTQVDVMLSASVLRDGSGRPVHYIAQLEDITEQRRAEQEHRLLAAIGPVFAESLDFEDTLTRIAESVVHEMADLCVVDILETEDESHTMKTAGRDPEVVALYERLRRVYHVDDRPGLVRQLFETKQSMLVQRPSPEQLEMLRLSELHREALRAARIESMILVPLLVHGRLTGGIGVISSSPTRIYGRADLKLAEALALRAALSIENARLYRAAKRATTVRDDVLGVVAHDLRNPLTNIMLNVEMALEGATEQQLAHAMHGIARSASRMERLIRDLLDIAQIEAGKLSVELGRLNVKQVLSDSIDAQRALAGAASIELALAPTADALEVEGDRHRLGQILENLIGNAIKFTEPGGSITVSATRRSDEVLFFVSDTGRGISTTALPHLFDRFWQVDGRDRHQGAGLGLAIVKGLVEAHGGRIWVESVPGQGSTFYFTIPAASPPWSDVAARP